MKGNDFGVMNNDLELLVKSVNISFCFAKKYEPCIFVIRLLVHIKCIDISVVR